MVELSKYLDDGKNWQAQALLAYLRSMDEFYADNYTGTKLHKLIDIRVSPYDGDREYGYVLNITIHSDKKYDNEEFCMSYGFFEAPSSDSIVVLKAKTGSCYGSNPTSNQMWKNHKGSDYDAYFPYGKIVEAGDWIYKDIRAYIDDYAYTHSELTEKY